MNKYTISRNTGNKPGIALLAILILLLSGCSNDDPADISGLWSGTIESNRSAARGETVVFEFFENGKCRMGDPENVAVESQTRSKEFKYSLDNYHIEVEAFLSLYYMQFYYEFSETDETLEIILVQRNFYNDQYDSFNPGDRILLTRYSDSSFSSLLN